MELDHNQQYQKDTSPLKKAITETEQSIDNVPLLSGQDKKVSIQQKESKNNYNEMICINDSEVMLVFFVGKKLEIQGRLRVTNYHINFLINKNNIEQAYIKIPLAYACKSQRMIEEKVGTTIEILLKYGCSFKIKYAQNRYQNSQRANHIINKLIQTSTHYAYQYGSSVLNTLKWRETQYTANLMSSEDSHWYDNQAWNKLPNYPQKFKVPLPYLSKNNPEDRFVMLCFVYSKDGALWRTGPGKSDPSQQQWVAKSKYSNKLFTVEIKNKGIGLSKSNASRVTQLQGLGLLKESFSNIFRLSFNHSEPMKWLAGVNQSRWLEQIAILLEESYYVINRVTDHCQVTILADSEPRGAQIAALVQVLLFPENRTVLGLGQIIETEFLQIGHSKAFKRDSQLDKGIIIIQFLDCIFQLLNIYPLSFQFNQNYLVFLAEQVYSNKYGNFLLAVRAIKEQERQSLNRCCSIWLELKCRLEDGETASSYLNPFYVDFKECDIYQLKQYLSAKHLKIWNGFFFKKLGETNNLDYKIVQRYQEISKIHYQNKKETEQLRKKLSEQHRILNQRRQLLKELKAIE